MATLDPLKNRTWGKNAPKFNLKIYSSCDKNYNSGVILIFFKEGRMKLEHNNVRIHLHWIVYVAYKEFLTLHFHLL